MGPWVHGTCRPHLYKASAGVATISVRSNMLTPISEPKEESQVLQQLSNGTIKFDIDAGGMISKDLNWDKVVVGFFGVRERARLFRSAGRTGYKNCGEAW